MVNRQHEGHERHSCVDGGILFIGAVFRDMTRLPNLTPVAPSPDGRRTAWKGEGAERLSEKASALSLAIVCSQQ